MEQIKNLKKSEILSGDYYINPKLIDNLKFDNGYYKCSIRNVDFLTEEGTSVVYNLISGIDYVSIQEDLSQDPYPIMVKDNTQENLNNRFRLKLINTKIIRVDYEDTDDEGNPAFYFYEYSKNLTSYGSITYKAYYKCNHDYIFSTLGDMIDRDSKLNLLKEGIKKATNGTYIGYDERIRDAKRISYTWIPEYDINGNLINESNKIIYSNIKIDGKVYGIRKYTDRVEISEGPGTLLFKINL